MSLVCPWNCSVCCVDAVHVTKKKSKILLESEGLSNTDYIGDSGNSIYDQAQKFMQIHKSECTYEGKLKVLNNLRGINFHIEFSGGDPLVSSENLKVIEQASRIFGRENIEVVSTGAGLGLVNPEYLAKYVHMIKFTYDSAEADMTETVRPAYYNSSNLSKIKKFKETNMKVRALIPITGENTQESAIRKIYENLRRAEVDEIKLMRLFPVGRGMNTKAEMPSKDDYLRAINLFQRIENEYDSGPKVGLQCALKGLTDTSGENPCDLYSGSLGIMHDGTLLTSAWAMGPTGKPLNDAFVLGNLIETPVTELLESSKGKEYSKRLNENFGHCKIFSYLNSKKENSLDRIFDATDPLYKIAIN